MNCEKPLNGNAEAICLERKCRAYGLISKGNGEVILTEETHMSLSTGGGQAGQGYPAVLVVGIDLYNQTITGGVEDLE